VNVVAPEWTEGRLDDLNDKVDRGFEKVDQRFEKVDLRLERIDARLDGIQKTMVQAVIGMTAAFLACFGGIIGLIATQL
jgi:tetrahydromethanopterin S-methyltransferase subunit G